MREEGREVRLLRCCFLLAKAPSSHLSLRLLGITARNLTCSRSPSPPVSPAITTTLTATCYECGRVLSSFSRSARVFSDGSLVGLEACTPLIIVIITVQTPQQTRVDDGRYEVFDHRVTCLMSLIFALHYPARAVMPQTWDDHLLGLALGYPSHPSESTVAHIHGSHNQNQFSTSVYLRAFDAHCLLIVLFFFFFLSFSFLCLSCYLHTCYLWTASMEDPYAGDFPVPPCQSYRPFQAVSLGTRAGRGLDLFPPVIPTAR